MPLPGRLEGLDTRLPDRRVARGVKNSDHDNLSRLFSVKHHIGELRHHRLSHVPIDRRVKLRICRNTIEYLANPRDEIDTESRLLLFVPIRCGVELGFGLGK